MELKKTSATFGNLGLKILENIKTIKDVFVTKQELIQTLPSLTARIAITRQSIPFYLETIAIILRDVSAHKTHLNPNYRLNLFSATRSDPICNESSLLTKTNLKICG